MDSARRRITLKTFYRQSERRKRISFDVDKKHLRWEPLKVLRLYFCLRYFFPDCEVTVYTTRKGFHVKAVGDAVALIPVEKRVDFRETLGDDVQRIEHERLKLRLGLPYLVDTLFQIKFYPDGKVGREERIDPVALPYVSRVPCKKKP